MIIGTSYFKDIHAAIHYYSDYYYCIQDIVVQYEDVAQYVQHKLINGEIHIGKPPINIGERIFLNSEERYCISAR